MRRNCKTEMELSSKKLMSNNGGGGMGEGEGGGERPGDSKGQHMNMFYDGAYDVTELRARAILLLASHETEKRMCKGEEENGSARPLPEFIQQRLCSPMTGVSMKGSLQRFLQKRKLRAQARLPY